MKISHCSLNPNKDIVMFSHGLTGHRSNWLRVFMAEAKRQKRKIHYVMGTNLAGEKILHSMQHKNEDVLCLHISLAGSKGVGQEVLELRARYPQVLISTGEGEEWLRLIWRLRRKVRVLFMRPYLQGFSFKSLRNYVVKFFVIGFISCFQSSKIGLLAIPRDNPTLFRSKWIDEMSSIREIPNEKRLFIYENLLDEVGLPADAEMVLVPGFITQRKNPELLINAFTIFQKSYSRDRCVLLFSGKVDENVKELINRYQSESIFCLDRYLTEEEYSCLLSNCKLVILAYSNRASSGVLVDCLDLARKVIFTGDRRWQNLFNSVPNLLIKGRKKPSELAEQIWIGLTSAQKIHDRVLWRSDREDILQFFFN